LPSCGSAPDFSIGGALQLQGLVPRSEFLETMVRSQHASLWFPFRVLTLIALAHGLIPGPSSFTLPASRSSGARRPGVLRNGESGPPFPESPTLVGFSTFRSREVSPTSKPDCQSGLDVSSSRWSPSEFSDEPAALDPDHGSRSRRRQPRLQRFWQEPSFSVSRNRPSVLPYSIILEGPDSPLNDPDHARPVASFLALSPSFELASPVSSRAAWPAMTLMRFLVSSACRASSIVTTPCGVDRSVFRVRPA